MGKTTLRMPMAGSSRRNSEAATLLAVLGCSSVVQMCSDVAWVLLMWAEVLLVGNMIGQAVPIAKTPARFSRFEICALWSSPFVVRAFVRRQIHTPIRPG
jgi:hypothetical protein